jgi:hypothetical protein
MTHDAGISQSSNDALSPSTLIDGDYLVRVVRHRHDCGSSYPKRAHAKSNQQYQ